MKGSILGVVIPVGLGLAGCRMWAGVQISFGEMQSGGVPVPGCPVAVGVDGNGG